MSRSAAKIEYGDFQTPPKLARAACQVVLDLGIRPAGLLEPTCGEGSFLKAGLAAFKTVSQALALDIREEYVRTAAAGVTGPVEVRQADFFQQDWRRVVRELPEPLLVLGNLPWVTSAALGAICGVNVPAKSNFDGRGGMDALTGKSNFDISEYMLIRLAEALEGRNAALAVLVKTAVARRLLAHRWRSGLPAGGCHIFPIDARSSFGAAVSACLLVASFQSRGDSCAVHSGLGAGPPVSHIGFRDGLLVADLERFADRRSLAVAGVRRWRSGIKHDCSLVMEFRESEGRLINGLGEKVEIEDELLYPLVKSSALSGAAANGNRWILVTQRETGEDTSRMASSAPKTWEYLLRHAARLDARRSAVYRRRPRFAIFGVGPYSFAPWKVAISGLYKNLRFSVLGPRNNKPVMLDDTCYFLPFESSREAGEAAAFLNSPAAREFYSSLIFWDAKRPITAEILNRLNLPATPAGDTPPVTRITGGSSGRDDVRVQYSTCPPAKPVPRVPRE